MSIKQPTNEKKSVTRHRSSLWGPALLVLYYAAVVALSWHSVWWVPTPQPADAPAAQFSEGRAMAQTSALADDIGDRAVTTPGNRIAAAHLYAEGVKLKELAARHRPDLDVQVDWESATGAVNMVLIHQYITNAYANVSNVVVAITPKALPPGAKAVLLNAHFDNTLGSPGASDCASCCGVLLELARTIIADASVPIPAPLVLLLNGAEETFLQASHGFAQSSKWAPSIGAFINLESTGNGGPDVLFQHTGHWTVATYARSALTPRGSVIGQDIFDMGLLPADTDFRMFSYGHHGQWPGIDIAFLLDAAAYHTDRDVTTRIRPGTLQMAGDNLMRVVPAFGAALAGGAADGPRGTTRASAYMDILGLVMITWSPAVARVLHAAPLVLAVLLAPRLSLPLRSLVGLGCRAVAGALLAALAPAAVGILRVALFGSPMVWFGKHFVAYAIYVPAALFGLLLPYAGISSPAMLPMPATNGGTTTGGATSGGAALAPASALLARRRALPAALLGWAAGGGALAATATLGAGLASGGLFAIWAGVALAASLLTRKVGVCWQVPLVAGLATPASLLMVAGAISYNTHVLDKVTMCGSHSPPIGPFVADIAAGALQGVGVLAAVGPMAPTIAAAFGSRFKTLLLGLLLVSGSAAAAASLTLQPYTLLAPKKIVLNHLHSHGPGASPAGSFAAAAAASNGTGVPAAGEDAVTRSVWSITSFDSGPVERALPAGMDWQPVPTQPRELQMLYPVSEVWRPISFAAPPPHPRLTRQLPAVHLVRSETLPSVDAATGQQQTCAAGGDSSGSCTADGGSRKRLHMELRLQSMGWGVMNVTGPLLAWSFTAELPTAPVPHGGGALHNVVRFAGNEGSETWAFWLELPASAPPAALRLELAASVKSLYVNGLPEPETADLRDVAGRMPAWTALAATSSFQSVWHFP